MEISLGTLKDKGEELAAFLEPRVGTKPSISGGTLDVEDGSIREGVRPRHVKTYIKRFMYMKGIKKNYRIFVSGNELTIQEIELSEEKEKEEKEVKEKKAKKSKEETEEEPTKNIASDEKKTETKSPEPPKQEKKTSQKKPRSKKKTEPEEAKD